MSFATTSHIAVTGVLAIAVFLSVTIIGFVKQRRGLPGAVLGHRRAAGAAPDPRDDRADLLLRAARSATPFVLAAT